MIKRIGAIAGCIISLGIIVGWFINYDAKVVKAEDMKQIQQSLIKLNRRIDCSDLRGTRADYQKRIWVLEDRYGRDVAAMPPGVRDEYRMVTRDMQRIQSRIKQTGCGE